MIVLLIYRYSDEEFSSFEKTRQVLDELDIPVTCYRLIDCIVLQEVCMVVSTRAAYLAAAGNIRVYENRT